jgi:hypothetical protein
MLSTGRAIRQTIDKFWETKTPSAAAKNEGLAPLNASYDL